MKLTPKITKRRASEMKTLDRIRNDNRVEHLDLDDPCGPIVTLRQGWSFDPLCDNRVAGEDTAGELLRTIRRALRYYGPYTT
jgi:hypothetical protein